MKRILALAILSVILLQGCNYDAAVKNSQKLMDAAEKVGDIVNNFNESEEQQK